MYVMISLIDKIIRIKLRAEKDATKHLMRHIAYILVVACCQISKGQQAKTKLIKKKKKHIHIIRKDDSDCFKRVFY